MSAIPRPNYVTRWKIARKIYELGPQTEIDLVQLLEIDPRERKQFLKSVSKMVSQGNLTADSNKLDLHPELRAYMADIREAVVVTRTVREACNIAHPRTADFKPLDLGKYPHLRAGAARNRSFVSMSSRVRTPLDVMGEV